MAVTPNSISFTYKKYLDAPYVSIEVTPDQPADQVNYSGVPLWIQLIKTGETRNQQAKITSQTYKVQVKAESANNLNIGYHLADIQFTYFRNQQGSSPLGSLAINLEVIDNLRLSLSKTDYAFQYETGGTVPATQPLTITTENNWSIIGDQPWITFSASNGGGTQTIEIGVNVSGLAVGLYEGTFQVDDGQSIKQGNISLLVSGDSSGGDYLTLSRTSLSFSEVYQQAPTRSGSITIDSSLAVTITTPAAWLSLSASNFAAGSNQLVVSTQNTEGLAIGDYPTTIKIESGFSTKTVNVLLRILEISSTGIVNGALYFAEDRNTLVLSSSTPNAEAYFEFYTSPKNYQRRVPFFNDLAKVVIGLETSTLLKPNNLPATFQSGAFVPVTPLNMDFTVYDKVINNTAITERQAYSNVKFLNGKSPSQANRLSYIPNKITVPGNGLISFSFYSEVPVNSINISGDHTAEIAISNLNSNIYAAVIDLAPYGLVAGQHISITCGPVSVDVAIKPTELETTRLIWLNEWDCPEVFNLDGLVEIVNEEESDIISLSQNGKEVSRIIEIQEPVSFRVGTGNIYSNEEVAWLAKVMRSKKTWLELQGERIEVTRDFRSLPVYATRENTRNFNLRFDAAVK